MTAETHTSISKQVSETRLWFGFAAIPAWVLAGLLNVLFAWQACMGGEAGSSVFTRTGIEMLLGFITFGLLIVGVIAGLVSYKNWQRLTDKTDVFHGEGTGRKQYMAVAGVIATVIMGAGMIWFAVPIYVLNICMRWR